MGISRLLKRGLTPTATVGVGCLENWRLRFNKKSYKDPTNGFANVEPFWGERVYGVIFGIRASDVAKLDKFEGYPKHYQRTELRVRWTGAENTYYDCVTYVANRRWTTSKRLVVTEDYRSYIDIGIRENLAMVPFTNTYIVSMYALMENEMENENENDVD